jgi:putative hydrolase
MIDLHMHTIFSDGELIPAELTRRAAVAGYRAMAITDHGDMSNMDLIIPRIAAVADDMGAAWGITVIPGIELTHIAPPDIAAAAKCARDLGAKIVVCHGETIVEPVAPGTNRAAIEAGVDILSHPGLITLEDVKRAAELGVCLELTTRKSHAYCNGHVAKLAFQVGAKLVVNSDSHAPSDLASKEFARKVANGAGLSNSQFDACLQNSAALVVAALS